MFLFLIFDFDLIFDYLSWLNPIRVHSEFDSIPSDLIHLTQTTPTTTPPNNSPSSSIPTSIQVFQLHFPVLVPGFARFATMQGERAEDMGAEHQRGFAVGAGGEGVEGFDAHFWGLGSLLVVVVLLGQVISGQVAGGWLSEVVLVVVMEDVYILEGRYLYRVVCGVESETWSSPLVFIYAC